jgi:homoserine O-acetyltransferase
MRHLTFLCLLPFSLFAQYPSLAEGDFTIRDYHFANGEQLNEVRIHYTTIGTPRKNAEGRTENAVLLLHGTGGTGRQFLTREVFDKQLFGPGQLLDAEKYFLILPDNIGHGKSSKPSDGLRARFPRYGYRDMIETQRRLLEEKLGVNHLRLVLGTSMGCMHAWMWGTEYPEYADALMPLACLPYPITGRNLLWRKMVVDLIKNDPDYKEGNYTTAPKALRAAADIQLLMTSNTLDLQKRGATRPQAETLFEEINRPGTPADANDRIYQIESSYDYNPNAKLEKIRAAVFAINFADDPINPPELGIFEREVKRVPGIRYLLMPATSDTKGHGNHTRAVLWKQHLEELLRK